MATGMTATGYLGTQGRPANPGSKSLVAISPIAWDSDSAAAEPVIYWLAGPSHDFSYYSAFVTSSSQIAEAGRTRES